MVGWGIFLIILGAGSLLLPMFDLQFRLMELVDPYQPYAGIAVAVIGAIMVFLGQTRRSGATTVEASTPSQAAGAGTTPAADDSERRP